MQSSARRDVSLNRSSRKKFVRDSRFRHLLVEPSKDRFEGTKLSEKKLEGPGIAINSQYLAFPWQTGGGGSLCVLDWRKPRRLATGSVPAIIGHTGAILDFGFSPFDERLIATGAEDCCVRLFQIPGNADDGSNAVYEIPPDNPVKDARCMFQTSKKVNVLCFHPRVQLLSCGSYDARVQTFDLESEREVSSLQVPDLVHDLRWGLDGRLLGAACRDKVVRFYDSRLGGGTTPSFDPGFGGQCTRPVLTQKVSESTRGCKMCWLDDLSGGDVCSFEFIATGFSQSTERQFSLWDIRYPGTPRHEQTLDTGTGALCPFYDRETGLLFLAGKGDGNIKFFEYVDGSLHYLDDYASNQPQRGLAFFPKRVMDVSTHEVARAAKLDSESNLTFLPFKVPRRAMLFQDDLYPPTAQLNEPAMSVSEFLVAVDAADQRLPQAEGESVDLDVKILSGEDDSSSCQDEHCTKDHIHMQPVVDIDFGPVKLVSLNPALEGKLLNPVATNNVPKSGLLTPTATTAHTRGAPASTGKPRVTLPEQLAASLPDGSSTATIPELQSDAPAGRRSGSIVFSGPRGSMEVEGRTTEAETVFDFPAAAPSRRHGASFVLQGEQHPLEGLLAEGGPEAHVWSSTSEEEFVVLGDAGNATLRMNKTSNKDVNRTLLPAEFLSNGSSGASRNGDDAESGIISPEDKRFVRSQLEKENAHLRAEMARLQHELSETKVENGTLAGQNSALQLEMKRLRQELTRQLMRPTAFLSETEKLSNPGQVTSNQAASSSSCDDNMGKKNSATAKSKMNTNNDQGISGGTRGPAKGSSSASSSASSTTQEYRIIDEASTGKVVASENLKKIRSPSSQVSAASSRRAPAPSGHATAPAARAMAGSAVAANTGRTSATTGLGVSSATSSRSAKEEVSSRTGAASTPSAVSSNGPQRRGEGFMFYPEVARPCTFNLTGERRVLSRGSSVVSESRSRSALKADASVQRSNTRESLSSGVAQPQGEQTLGSRTGDGTASASDRARGAPIQQSSSKKSTVSSNNPRTSGAQSHSSRVTPSGSRAPSSSRGRGPQDSRPSSSRQIVATEDAPPFVEADFTTALVGGSLVSSADGRTSKSTRSSRQVSPRGSPTAQSLASGSGVFTSRRNTSTDVAGALQLGSEAAAQPDVVDSAPPLEQADHIKNATVVPQPPVTSTPYNPAEKLHQVEGPAATGPLLDQSEAGSNLPLSGGASAEVVGASVATLDDCTVSGAPVLGDAATTAVARKEKKQLSSTKMV
ncbi:unnamed protein product [Amoebophrya sp. A25]|nr:unnamed protein product [Amoebophrya sp. A25]|eukprot:GSA25T00011093001.1